MGFYSFYRIIKDVIRTIFGNKVWRMILIAIIVAIIVYWVLSITGYCATTTTDQALVAYELYDSYVDYALTLLSVYPYNSSETIDCYTEVIDLLNDGYYLYVVPTDQSATYAYASTTSRRMNFFNINYSRSSTTAYFFFLYKSNSSSITVLDTDTYNQWNGCEDLSIVQLSNSSFADYYYAVFPGNEYSVRYANSNLATYGIYMPYIFYTYYTDTLYEIVNSDSQSQVDSIIEALETQTDETVSAIEETTSAIESLEETITSDDVDTSDYSIDTSASDSVDDSSFTTLFSDTLSVVQSSFTYDDDDVITITIPFWGDNEITISSDMFRQFITSNYEDYAFYNLIHIFYYFVFAKYIIAFVYNFVLVIKNGDMLNGKYNTWTALDELL